MKMSVPKHLFDSYKEFSDRQLTCFSISCLGLLCNAEPFGDTRKAKAIDFVPVPKNLPKNRYDTGAKMTSRIPPQRTPY